MSNSALLVRLTTMVGSATSTTSEYMISGLPPGTQYWMHVRPHRGGQTAAWSDSATRVARVWAGR